MPHSDMRGTQNKARVAEAVRGTYPIWNRFSRKEDHVDMIRKNHWRLLSSINEARKSDNVTRWSLEGHT